jgi:hypothetical protein
MMTCAQGALPTCILSAACECRRGKVQLSYEDLPNCNYVFTNVNITAALLYQVCTLKHKHNT